MISGACIEAHIVLIATVGNLKGDSTNWRAVRTRIPHGVDRLANHDKVLLNIQEITSTKPIFGARGLKSNIVIGSVD